MLISSRYIYVCVCGVHANVNTAGSEIRSLSSVGYSKLFLLREVQ